MRDGTRLTRPAALSLAFLAVVPFLYGLRGGFTYDDKLIIRDNERISSPSRVREIFTTHYFGGPLTTGTAYRPLVLLTYALERWTFGNQPLSYHIVNVLLHAAVTVAFAAWLLAIGFPRGPSLAAASLFAVLTIHVEAVTGIVGRAEVLSALLVFVSARQWLKATSRGRLALGPYAGCLAAFLAAVFVKENAIVLPGVIILSELFRGGDGKDPLDRSHRLLGARGLALAGLAFPMAFLFAARKLVLQGFLISKQAGIFDLENPLVALSPDLRAANAAFILLRYVAKTFVPVGLSADHSAYALTLATSLKDPRVWIGILGLLAGFLLTIRAWKTRPFAAFGSALFFGTFLPTANLLFPIGTIYAERLVYLPSAGLVCLAVGSLLPAARHVPRPSLWPWRPVLLSLAITAYAAATLARSRVFRDDATLYADMIEKMPGSAKAHYNVAHEISRGGDSRRALTEVRLAREIFPRFYDAWALEGRLLWDDKKVTEAVACYRRSVEILPHYENGLWGLARTLQESGQIEGANAAFEKGLKEFPSSYPLAYHRAVFLEEQDRFADAEAAWVVAVKAGEGTAVARLAHAKVLARLGREKEAWDEARRALLADGRLVAARFFLAERYELAGKTLAAAGELSRACRTQPADEETLAVLLEFAVRHPEARSRASLALASAPVARRVKPGVRLSRAIDRFRAS